MKKLKLFIAFIFLTYGLSAQVESIGLTGLDELWGHQSVDTDMDISSNCDGRNHIYSNYINHSAINDENYIFVLSRTATYDYGTGGLLQKIDYRTGELMWSTPFDLRNNTTPLNPYYYRILEDEIQVVSFRSKISSSTPFEWHEGKPESRYYSMQSGVLNNVVYSEDTPANLNPSIIIPANDSYCYFKVSLINFDSIHINAWRDDMLYFDNYTNTYDTIQQVHLGEYSSNYAVYNSNFFVDNNNISSVIYFGHPYSNPDKQETILRTYNVDDRTFQLLNLTNLIDEPNDSYEIISIEDDDCAVLQSTQYVKDSGLIVSKIMKFNLNHNTSKIVNLNYDNDSDFIASNVFELGNDKILAINRYCKGQNKGEPQEAERYKMLLFDKNLNYDVVKEFRVNESNSHYNFYDCMLLPGDILLLRGGKSIVHGDVSSIDYDFCVGIDAKKLGIVKNKEIHNDLSIDIFPNPTSGSIVISGISSKAEVEILDESGRCLYKGVLNSPSERLDISKYKNGVYFVRVKSKNGILNTQKVVKM